MPRILFVTTSFENGAIPNILLDLAPYWRQDGWDCHFLALEPFPKGHSSIQRCRDLGFPLESLNVGPTSVFRALLRLRSAIRRLRPDILSTHLGRADIYTPWVKGRIPQVTTHHNILSHHGRLTRWGYRISDSRVAARSGVSQTCNESFLASGFLKTPHRVIFNPVDPARLTPSRTRQQVLAAEGWEDSVRLLVTVARLADQKGYPDLIHAIHGLHQRGWTQIRLLAAGEGPCREELEKLVRSVGLDSCVRFLGRVEDVASLYAAADLFVLPSHWEGLGLVVLEAWTQDCPIAASDLPAIREFVENGKNGVLFPPQEPQRLADALESLLRSPGTAQQLAANGHRLVVERFSPRQIAHEYTELFRSALSPPKP